MCLGKWRVAGGFQAGGGAYRDKDEMMLTVEEKTERGGDTGEESWLWGTRSGRNES